MKAVVDENLPAALAKALNALAGTMFQDEILHSTDVVGRGCPDDELFRKVASAGITVHITQDHHHRRPLERQVIAECGLVVFTLAKAWSSHTFWDKSCQLIRWWPAIRAHAERTKPPAIYRVQWKVGGRFEQVPLR